MQIDCQNIVMKTLGFSRMMTGVLVIFLLLGSLSGCANHPDDDWWAADKAAHFAASGIIGVNSSVIAHQEGASSSEAFGVGLAVALVAGVAKECFDLYIRRSYWSWKDLSWNLAGALTGNAAGVMCCHERL